MKPIAFFNYFSLAVVFCCLFSACDISENEIEPGLSFTKIYNSSSFTESYDPLDVVALPDSAYLILSSTNSWNIHLLKVDSEGELIWTQDLDEPYVNALPQLYQQENRTYLVCMDELQLGTYVLEVNAADGSTEEVFQDRELTYPLAAHLAGDHSWLIQSYNREARKTTITEIDAEFSQQWQQEFDILEDVEEKIVKHLTRTGDRLPFFNGYAQGNGNAGFYYFNGFNNYTMALTFLNPSDGEALGVMNGFRDLGYVNAANGLSNGVMALSKNSYGDNYLAPFSQINERTVSSSSDLEANNFPEIAPEAPVILKTFELVGDEVSFYATHSKSNRIMLYAYSATDGSLLGVEYLGQSSPYEIANILQTGDGGMLVLGKTYVAGRFARICLFKLTEEEVLAIIQ